MNKKFRVVVIAGVLLLFGCLYLVLSPAFAGGIPTEIKTYAILSSDVGLSQWGYSAFVYDKSDPNLFTGGRARPVGQISLFTYSGVKPTMIGLYYENASLVFEVQNYGYSGLKFK